MDKFENELTLNFAYNLRHLNRMAAYEKQINAILNKAVEEMAKEGTSATSKVGDEPFSFSKYPLTYKRVQKLMKQLHQQLVQCIVNGVSREWDLANDKDDDLADLVFSRMAWMLSDAEKKRYYKNNHEALAAFQARVRDGLNLSDRVWKYTNQFKTEIELGLDAGIRDGVAANEMARLLKQYLQEPDKLFRRVRDEHGILHLSKAAAAYHPTTGVYRSSYQNARRLAVTETNMAYRTADHLRYQQLDFVLGIEIHLSNNHTSLGRDGKPHPFKDICDDLKGQYPKDFKFVGWHPFCRCFVTSILMSREEMLKARAARRAGKAYKSPNAVADVPPAFKEWLAKNGERVKGWASVPYFLRDNYKYTGFGEPPTPPNTALTRAAQRHAARTPEEIDAIRREWTYRKAAIESADLMHDRLDGIRGIDLSKLSEYERTAQWGKVRLETLHLRHYVSELADLEYVGDGFAAAKKYGYNEVLAANAAIKKTLKDKVFSYVSTSDYEEMSESELRTVKEKLAFEAKYIDEHRKYDTWELVYTAYKNEQKAAESYLVWADIRDAIKDFESFAKRYATELAKEPDFATTLALLKEDVDNQNLESAKKAVGILKKMKSRLETEFAAAEAERKRKEAEERRKAFANLNLDGVVTYDDLKAKLGGALPKTLEHLEDAYKHFANGFNYGGDAEANAAEIEANMRYLFEKMSYGMNIKADAAAAVADTWFKNTFEVGTSNGYVGSTKTEGPIETSHDRLSAAHQMFALGRDLAKDQLDRREYEKYGNLLDSDILSSMTHYNRATQYGDIEVRFKKDKVIATYTAGDSLGLSFQPTLVTDPKAYSFDSWSSRRLPLGDITKLDMYQIRDKLSTSYIEMQYHGDVTPDCVESITFPVDLQNVTESNRYRVAADKWKALGIPVYYVAGDKLYTY